MVVDVRAEKFAYALTVLDGRTEITREDWCLSGIAAAVSEHTRNMVIGEAQLAVQTEAIERGRQQGIAAHEAALSKLERDRERSERLTEKVTEHLTAAGENGSTEVR